MVVDYSKPLLFIDLSYYVFYRYYALANWYKLSQTEPLDVDALETNTLFLTKFNKMFVENLRKLQKKHGVGDANTFFAKDCPRDEIWRRALYPDYKGTRETKRDFNGHIFAYTYATILPALAGIRMLEVAGAEADDIIGTLVFKLRREHPGLSMVIVTGDLDYLQLADARTHIENLRGVDLKTKGLGDPARDVLAKIIGGDVSDNIGPAFKCTKKRLAELVADTSALEAALQCPKARAGFELNRALVDMREIPPAYREKIEALLI